MERARRSALIGVLVSHVVHVFVLSPAVGGDDLAERDKKLYEKPLINLSCSRQVSIRSLIRVYTP